MLEQYNLKPFFLFNWLFSFIGFTIQKLCYVSPHFLLDFVAQSMEFFAVFNYRKLATFYPEFETILVDMAENEEEHRQYFKR